MNLGYITPQAFKEFGRRYPAAYHFLVASSLKEEKRRLTRELEHRIIRPERRRWITARLEELADI